MATQVASLFGVLSLEDRFTPTLDRAERRSRSFGENLTRVGLGLTALSAPIIGFATSSVGAFVAFEAAMAGVAKTVNLSDAELENLSDTFREMSTSSDSLVSGLDNAQVTLANIGQIAGQLGVRGVDNIAHFSETIGLLTVATNLSATAAATNLARFANILSVPIENVDHLGNVLVDLGNNFATTESEILNMSTRMAGVAGAAGFSADEIFGLAAALSAVGIQAEVGGSNVGIALNRISKIVGGLVEDSDIKLAELGRITGMTGEAFSDLWNTDTSAAFSLLIAGFEQAALRGENLTVVLDGIDIKNIRTQRLFTSLAGATGLLAESQGRAAAAIGNTNALMTEAERFSRTLQFQLRRVTNIWRDLRIEVGEALAPALGRALDRLEPILRSITDWVAANPDLVVTIIQVGLAVGVLGAGLVALGLVITSIGAVFGGLIGILASPLILAVVAGLAVLGSELGLSWSDVLDIFGRVPTVLGAFIDHLQSGVPFIEAVRLAIIGLLGAEAAAKIVPTLTDVTNFIQFDLIPALQDFWKWIKDLATEHGGLILKVLAVGVGLWALSVPVGIVIGVVSTLATGIGLLASAISGLILLAMAPLGLALIVGGALVAAYLTNWMGFRDFIDNQVRPVLLDMIDLLTQVTNALINTPKNVEAAIDSLRQYEQEFNEPGGGFSRIVGAITRGVGGIIDDAGRISIDPRDLLNIPQIRDMGGPVRANQPVLIGTGAQPEMFTPSVNGFMTPNAGGMNVNVNLNVTEGNARTAGMNFADGLAARMRSKGLRPTG